LKASRKPNGETSAKKTVKNKPLTGLDKYIKDIRLFEEFLHAILAYEYVNIQDDPQMQHFLDNYHNDNDNQLEIEFDSDLFRFDSMWCDNLDSLIDLAINENKKVTIESAIFNIEERFAGKMYRASIDAHQALAGQIYGYFDEKGIEYFSLYERLSLYRELSKRVNGL
jgi:hypothetical protein